jgi:hypothetical protein
MKTADEIRRWMLAHGTEHIDNRTNELNMTSLVEAWDEAEGTGEETLDENHIAWEIAVDVKDKVEGKAR